MKKGGRSLMQYCMEEIHGENKKNISCRIEGCTCSKDPFTALFFICLATPRDRKVTHNDSFGKLTPPAARVFFGIWRKRRTTSSRFSLLASTGKARQARKSISAPSRNLIVSPPTAPIKVSSSEMVGYHHMPPASMAVNNKTLIVITSWQCKLLYLQR